MRRSWIDEGSYPPSPQSINDTRKASASEIRHLNDRAAVVPGIGKPGYHEIAGPTDDADAMRRKDAQVEPAASDAQMVRVAEDIFDALAAKNVLSTDDLPKAAASLIAGRKKLCSCVR